MTKLRELREEKRLTRTQLAAKIGVSERYIFFLEAGSRTPSLKTAHAISHELGATVDEIFLSTECTKCTHKNDVSEKGNVRKGII